MRKTIYMEDVLLKRGGTFLNFSGAPTPFDKEGGKRYFHVIIEDREIADLFSNEYGMNIKPDKWLAEKDPDAEPRWYFKVNVGFNYPPKIVMIQNGIQIELDENTCGQIDHANIEKVDFGFVLSHWENHLGSGNTPYLTEIYVTVEDDPLARKYNIGRSFVTVDVSDDFDNDEVPF